MPIDKTLRALSDSYMKKEAVVLTYVPKDLDSGVRIKPVRIEELNSKYFYADSVDGRKKYLTNRVIDVAYDRKRNPFDFDLFSLDFSFSYEEGKLYFTVALSDN